MFTPLITFATILVPALVNPSPNEAWQSFAQCQGCKLFSESFEKGMRKTSKSNFGGGDASWEKNNLGSYANSEVRLVEIQEAICEEVENDVERSYCQSFNENYEPDIEDWWYKKQEKFPDMHKYLCLQKLKLCKCKPGYFERAGSCIDVNECDLPRKNDCKEDQYCLNTKGSYKCINCDTACETCDSSGPKGCKSCAPGYKLIGETCLSEVEESRNHLVYLAAFWVAFTGIYFLRKSYALIIAIAGLGFCIYISISDYMFQLPISINDDETFNL